MMLSSQGFDLEAFTLLEDSDLPGLIPQKDIEVKFRKKLRDFKQSRKEALATKDTPEATCFVVRDGDGALIPCEPDIDLASSSSEDRGQDTEEVVASPLSPVQSSNNSDGPSCEPEVAPDSRSKRKRPAHADAEVSQVSNSVRQYLESSATGLLILGLYPNNFNEATRNDLASYIVANEFGPDTQKVITPKRFKTLAEQIVEVFPSEEEETYYIPRRKKSSVSEAVNPRGKLYHKYTRVVAKLRLASLRSKGDTCEEEEGEETHDTESADVVARDLAWLRICMGPEGDARSRWTRTSAARMKSLRSAETGTGSTKKVTVERVTEYLDEFRSLRQPWGHSLLEIDFKHLYPGSDMCLLEEWNSVSAKIKALAVSRRIDIGDSTSSDEHTVKVLLTIPKFFKPTTLGKWKPSALELSQGFLLHVKTNLELNETIERLKEKLKLAKKPLQPFPVIVGRDTAHIDHSYLYLDNFYYSVESPLKAVDTCFKAFHALHAHYPYQSQAPWQFLQQAIYRIKTKWDSGIPAASTAVKEFQNLVIV